MGFCWAFNPLIGKDLWILRVTQRFQVVFSPNPRRLHFFKGRSHKKKRENAAMNSWSSKYGWLSLVGGWTNPFEKYDRQIGSFPQVGVKIKNIRNHHLDHFMIPCSTSRHLSAWRSNVSYLLSPPKKIKIKKTVSHQKAPKSHSNIDPGWVGAIPGRGIN